MTETSQFDWPRFAAHVKAFLGLHDLTYRAASARFGGSYAMWFRAQSGKTLSVGNALFVARTAGLDIYDYSVFARRTHVKQAIGNGISAARETEKQTAFQTHSHVSCENDAETGREARR